MGVEVYPNKVKMRDTTQLWDLIMPLTGVISVTINWRIGTISANDVTISKRNGTIGANNVTISKRYSVINVEIIG